MEEYFKQCFLICHIYAISDFSQAFPGQTNKFLVDHKVWLKQNVEDIIWESIVYMEQRDMMTRLEDLLEVQIPHIFYFLKLKYTRRFYTELNALNYQVARPDGMRERAIDQVTVNKRQRYAEGHKEKDLDQVLKEGYEILSQKDNDTLEEDEAIRLIAEMDIPQALRSQLTGIAKDEGVGIDLLYDFTQTRKALSHLAELLKHCRGEVLDDGELLKACGRWFAKESSQSRDILAAVARDIINALDFWNERSISRKGLQQNVASKHALEASLQWLSEQEIIKLSEKRIHVEAPPALYLLLLSEMICSDEERKVELFRWLQSVKDAHFFYLAVCVLSRQDPKHFNQLFLYPLICNFLSDLDEDEKKDFYVYFARNKTQFDFGTEEQWLDSAGSSLDLLFTVLDDMGLFEIDDLLVPDIHSRLQKIPEQRGFEKRESGYSVDLGLIEDKGFFQQTGIAQRADGILNMLKQIKMFLEQTEMEESLSREALERFAR